ncbi:amino acid--tRNA ligase-related protein [Embleya sp. NPDC020630]|uniref:amino acid--tRNA ligase-related protein n=1 Tax=Embleya sp. NPDC020630 TaxID=3363979 RepID=UPI0037BB5137
MDDDHTTATIPGSARAESLRRDLRGLIRTLPVTFDDIVAAHAPDPPVAPRRPRPPGAANRRATRRRPTRPPATPAPPQRHPHTPPAHPGGDPHDLVSGTHADRPPGPTMPTPGSPATPIGQPAEYLHRLRTDARARDLLQARSAIQHTIRRRLDLDGHTHVDTPQPRHDFPGAHPGSAATTHHPGPDPRPRDRSPYLRAMLTAGFARVYEIVRGDATHTGEHTFVEIHRAHADYKTTRHLIQDLVRAAADAMPWIEPAPGAGPPRIDWARPWVVTTVHAAVGAVVAAPITPDTDARELLRLAARHGLDADPAGSADELLVHLYESLVRPATHTPTFHIDFPASQAPLARPCPHDTRLAQTWNLAVAGIEVATSSTEPADGAAPRARPPANTARADDDAATIDHGRSAVSDAPTPPAGSVRIDLDRLVQVLTGAELIDDVIAFPLPAAGRAGR